MHIYHSKLSSIQNDLQYTGGRECGRRDGGRECRREGERERGRGGRENEGGQMEDVEDPLISPR